MNKHISKFINKKYGFQYSVVIWTSKSSNYKEIDHDQLTFNGLQIEATYYNNSDLPTGAFFYLSFTNKDNDEVFIFNNWTFSSSPTINPFDHPVYDIWLIKCY